MPGEKRRQLWWLLGGVGLIVLLIPAIMIAVQVRRTSEFESIVLSSGGCVVWEEADVIPGWLHQLLPDVINHSIFDRSGIDFVSWTPGKTKTDADWLALHERLGNFEDRVTAILFEGSRIGDESVATFDKYPNIEVLNLSDTLVSNSSLLTIGKMTKLRILFLDRSNISESNLSELHSLRRLQYLGVTGIGLTQGARVKFQSRLPEVSISDD